jgi:hypothetical protein
VVKAEAETSQIDDGNVEPDSRGFTVTAPVFSEAAWPAARPAKFANHAAPILAIACPDRRTSDHKPQAMICCLNIITGALRCPNPDLNVLNVWKA